MLARRNPFRDLLRMRTEMDRMFEDAFQVPSWEWEPGSAALDLDVSEKDDEFLVKASIPGINPDDLDFTLNDRTLTIKGEMKAEEESKSGSPFTDRKK